MKQPILVYLVFTLFLGLKLTGHIAWSWVWVFAPLWISALLAVVVGFIVGFRAVRKPRAAKIDITNLGSTQKEWRRGMPDIAHKEYKMGISEPPKRTDTH